MSKIPRSKLGVWDSLSIGALVGVAVAFLTTLVATAGSTRLAYDFRTAYLQAAEAIRSGASPYVGGALADGQELYLYPPQFAIALVPLTTLPVDVAAFFAFLVCLASLIGALAVVGVRDIRCFASVLIWTPGWYALEMANVSAVLALAVALLWRYREMLWRPAVALGLASSTKLFLWPLLVWAVATKRFRVAGLAVAIGLSVTIGAWGAIGFRGLVSYPDHLARVRADDTYSIFAMTTALGGSETLGTVLMAIIGGALVGAVVILGRRGDDVRAFTCAIAAALALTPVVWQHYLVLLAVPLGLARPRFAAIWLLPIVLWVSPTSTNGDGVQPFVPAIVTTIMLTVILASPRSRAQSGDGALATSRRARGLERSTA